MTIDLLPGRGVRLPAPGSEPRREEPFAFDSDSLHAPDPEPVRPVRPSQPASQPAEPTEAAE
ncbi:hypothetical protein ACFU7Y_16360 [Kitasatospora sp. NPDC057542]|uniref:hypothetical protein n=1 Tax=Kitasatospora sp. NPDC057542 TaxID=3346162 RepID=UPI0036C492C8